MDVPAIRSLAVLGSLCAVAATVALWVHAWAEAARRAEADARQARRPDFEKWNRPLGEGRCAIAVARFGGMRARLVRVETGGTVHFAVIESAPRNTPLNALQQGDWLRARYGAAPTTTLGTFGSTTAALNRAGLLCPPALRCLPGRPGCEEVVARPMSPLDLFARPPSPEIGPQW